MSTLKNVALAIVGKWRALKLGRSRGLAMLGVASPMKRLTPDRCMAVTMFEVPSETQVPDALR
jgi:hypothetical protein